MFTRRQHKVPKGPRQDAITLLMDRAAVALLAHGAVRGPAAPWLAASRVLLVTRHSCGWDLDQTPTSILEPMLLARGWTWRWEGEELALELPGWVAPAPRVVAVQPRLIEEG